MCVHNNNILINIPSHPYLLLDRSILCNSDLEAESNILLESLVACEKLETKTDLVMYFTVHLAFVNHLEGAVESLRSEVSTNWTIQEQILPTSIENFEFDPTMLTTPQNMKDFLTQYKHRKEITEKTRPKRGGRSQNRLQTRISFMVDMLLFYSSIDYNSCYFGGDVYGVQTIKIKGFSSK